MLGTPQEGNVKMALLPFGNKTYYNHLEEKLEEVDIFGENFIISYPKDYTKWVITKTTKKIGKYTAYKAITKEKYGRDNQRTYTITAWFTPEVNIPYGPIGFGGLPGLILELSKYNVTYYVQNIELNPIKKVEVKKPSKGVHLTFKEFKKMISNARGKFKKIRG